MGQMGAKQQRETTNRSPKNDREIKQIFSEFRRKNRMNTEMEVAPIRTLDDFILTKSRFQIPNFQDEDRWFNRIIYNLMYYQTNYLIASALIFGFVLFARPQEMIMGIFLMTLVFGSIHSWSVVTNSFHDCSCLFKDAKCYEQIHQCKQRAWLYQTNPNGPYSRGCGH